MVYHKLIRQLSWNGLRTYDLGSIEKEKSGVSLTSQSLLEPRRFRYLSSKYTGKKRRSFFLSENNFHFASIVLITNYCLPDIFFSLNASY